MQALRAIVAWLVLLGLYLVLSGSTSLMEIIAGLGVTSLAMLPALIAPHRQTRRFILRPPFSSILHPLRALVTDTLRVAPVLLRAVLHRPHGHVGTVCRIPFRDGGETGRDAGRRGFVTLAVSFAPNGFALHIPDDEDALILHRLAPSRQKGSLDWPA